MLQPKSYPQMLGKALVLDGEAFITMVEDDDPWVEGLFMVVVMGLVVALAQFIGGLLLTLTLPPSSALLEGIVQGWRAVSDALAPGAAGHSAEVLLREQWGVVAAIAGIGGGWARLILFIGVPAALLAQWLLYGLVGHGMAKLLGGRASLNQTLGATALMVAPQALLLFKVVPFVSVSYLLISVWSLLIVYRALQIAHELSWGRAVGAALLAPFILFLAGGTMLSGLALLFASM